MTDALTLRTRALLAADWEANPSEWTDDLARSVRAGGFDDTLEANAIRAALALAPIADPAKRLARARRLLADAYARNDALRGDEADEVLCIRFPGHARRRRADIRAGRWDGLIPIRALVAALIPGPVA
jgi:hypothetical protein